MLKNEFRYLLKQLLFFSLGIVLLILAIIVMQRLSAGLLTLEDAIISMEVFIAIFSFWLGFSMVYADKKRNEIKDTTMLPSSSHKKSGGRIFTRFVIIILINFFGFYSLHFIQIFNLKGIEFSRLSESIIIDLLLFGILLSISQVSEKMLIRLLALILFTAFFSAYFYFIFFAAFVLHNHGAMPSIFNSLFWEICKREIGQLPLSAIAIIIVILFYFTLFIPFIISFKKYRKMPASFRWKHQIIFFAIALLPCTICLLILAHSASYSLNHTIHPLHYYLTSSNQLIVKGFTCNYLHNKNTNKTFILKKKGFIEDVLFSDKDYLYFIYVEGDSDFDRIYGTTCSHNHGENENSNIYYVVSKLDLINFESYEKLYKSSGFLSYTYNKHKIYLVEISQKSTERNKETRLDSGIVTYTVSHKVAYNLVIIDVATSKIRKIPFILYIANDSFDNLSKEIFAEDQINGRQFWLISAGKNRSRQQVLRIWEDGEVERIGGAGQEFYSIYIRRDIFSSGRLSFQIWQLQQKGASLIKEFKDYCLDEKLLWRGHWINDDQDSIEGIYLTKPQFNSKDLKGFLNLQTNEITALPEKGCDSYLYWGHDESYCLGWIPTSEPTWVKAYLIDGEEIYVDVHVT